MRSLATSARHKFLAILVVVLAAILALQAFRTRPTLARATSLRKAGHLAEAARAYHEYLQENPQSAQARFELAQIELEDFDHSDKPARKMLLDALEHLHRAKFASNEKAAEVRFLEASADERLLRYDEAEKALKEALELDPLVPEAGWRLLELYRRQGRDQESHDLVMRMHAVEPDPVDRVRLLLELVRQDIFRLAAQGAIQELEPAVHENPKDLRSTLALGVAMTREGRIDDGLALLRGAVDSRPGDPNAWDALLTGLEAAGQVQDLAPTLARIPKGLADDPRFDEHKGWAAETRGDWKAAIAAYQRVLNREPFDRDVVYRLANLLKIHGDPAERDRYLQRAEELKAAKDKLKQLYESRISQEPALGRIPTPELFQEIADLRERMGHPDEAIAWHRLVLRENPDNPVSRDALQRLKSNP